MNIIIVDDEHLALADMMYSLKSVYPESKINGFSRCSNMLKFIKTYPVDIAFLDISMPEMNGIELAKQVKELRSNVNIIFVTAYSEYALDAHKLYASGYLMKPVTKADIISAINNLRTPISTLETRPHIQVRTFGGFDVYADGKPLKFGRFKSKELLAYLVDRRGFTSTMQQIILTLWEDEYITTARKSHLRNLIADIFAVLKEVNADDIIIKSFNSLAVDPSKFECDYYDFLEGKSDGLNVFINEYMPEYSWAEVTLSTLEQKRVDKMAYYEDTDTISKNK